MRVTPEHLDQLLHPQLDAASTAVVVAKGLAASPGAGVGRVVLRRRRRRRRGRSAASRRSSCAPRRHPTTSTACKSAEAVLTSHGGLVSHAAVVARGWGIPAVVGVQDLVIERHHFVAGGDTCARASGSRSTARRAR